MTRVNYKYSGIAALCIGVAFAVHLMRTWWLELHIDPVTEQDFYSVADVMTIIDSPLWIVAGVLHIVVAAALSMLALPVHRQRSPEAIVAVVGSGCFLLLSMTHLTSVLQIETVTKFCAGDGHTALVAYNLVRAVLLGSAFFALGWFLLLDASSELRAGAAPKLIPIIGVAAGILCLVFVFYYAAAPLLITTLMMTAVAVWGLGQAAAMLSMQHPRRRGR